MVVVVQDATGYVLVRPSLAQRLLARLSAPTLDRALAAGTPPERDAVLAWRAHQLVRPATRRGLARGLRRLLKAASDPQPWLTPQVLPRRAEIRRSRRELTDLAEALAGPCPLAAQGIAMTMLMLSDPGSPIHSRSSRIDIVDAVDRILTALDPLAA